MTEKELELELKCYKEHINPDCDIDNMTAIDIEEFYTSYIENKALNQVKKSAIIKTLSQKERDFIKEVMNKRSYFE